MAVGDSNSFEAAAAASPQSVAQFEDDSKSLIHRIQHWLHQTPSAVPMIVLLLSILVFGLAAGNFFRTGTLSLILQQIAVVGILGCAQSIVVLTAGIDLSVGAMAVFTSVIMGMLTFRVGIPAPISILVGLVAGTAMGAVNGFLVARMRLPPFIVTLGTWQIILAANYLYSANETIRSQDIEAQAPLLQLWGWTFKIGVTTVSLGVLLLVVMVLVMAYVLKHTAWGRHVYAIGDDAEAAKLSGVQVSKTLIQVYALAGFFCAVAGWVMIGRFGSVSPSASTGVLGNIQSITAVVIGGISLFGGRGSILGMFFGALIVGVFELGLRMLGTDPQWTYLLIGALIIGAVAIDQWIRKA
jgi:fructose transport system permease protein